MRTSLLLIAAIALISSANAQIVFTSGFENWNDTLPTDWIGDKTNLTYDSITQVSANVHGGSYAVRLANPSSTNKRLTTLPMHMDAGTQYDFNFWVRGSGDIHVALFDERSGTGYSGYSTYVVVTGGSVWQEINASILCENTTNVGEFIIGCRNTDAPENLVVDDVVISVGVIVPPVEASIYEIQYTTAPDGISPYFEQAVLTGGIVTGIDTIGSDGFFIQNGQGPWKGVYVFATGFTVAIGDSVTFQGTVDEFQNKTELIGISAFVNHGPYPVPAPETLTAGDAEAEQWEGVLVKVWDIAATNLPEQSNGWEWIANSWQGDIVIDDLMYLYMPEVGNYYTVTGIMDQYLTDYQLCPRQLSDIEIGSGIGEFAGHSVVVFPNPANTTLTLDIPNISGRTEYILTDAIGRTVLAAVINAERNTIDVGSLPAGMYALTLRNGASTWSTSVAVKR